MHMSCVKLKTKTPGSTGALASFLADNAEAVGQSHHLIWSLFGERQGDRNFLYHMSAKSPSKDVYLYSDTPVQDSHDLWDVQTRHFALADNLQVGDRLIWDIRVNATRRKAGHANRIDIVLEGKRCDDGRDWLDVAQDVVTPWLSAKLSVIGLEAPQDAMEVIAYDRLKFAHDARRGGAPVTVAATDVRGIGTVTDPELLKAGLLKGIGAARSYGCGMLLVRRA